MPRNFIFGRAAERLPIARPPRRRTIKQLAAELGTRLLDRNTRFALTLPLDRR
ncbi:LysR family transcriptional regulator [Arthrobacter sp. MDT3-24]